MRRLLLCLLSLGFLGDRPSPFMCLWICSLSSLPLGLPFASSQDPCSQPPALSLLPHIWHLQRPEASKRTRMEAGRAPMCKEPFTLPLISSFTSPV